MKSSPTPYAIIVAGGTGSRMKSALPKQFLLLKGLPVIMHTINAFVKSRFKPIIILVIHPDFNDYWQELCKKYHFNVPHIIKSGSATRFNSVKNGLSAIEEMNAVVAIHDAVRPLTPTVVIDNAYDQAIEYGNAVVAIQSRDSVRQLSNGVSRHLNRDEIYLVQTPQTFLMPVIKNAYSVPYSPIFTDDASVVEHSGVKINLVEGSHDNIKITFPDDIAIAELLMNR